MKKQEGKRTKSLDESLASSSMLNYIEKLIQHYKISEQKVRKEIHVIIAKLNCMPHL